MTFLTSESIIKQISKLNKFKLCTNELYYDNKTGKTYLAWRNFITDNYTWLFSTNWDIRCSHIHDIACQYHQLVYIKEEDLNLVYKLYVINTDEGSFCNDIPLELLHIENITKRQADNLFYRMMKDADSPKIPLIIQILYRIGVFFNLRWIFTGKKKIDLNELY